MQPRDFYTRTDAPAEELAEQDRVLGDLAARVRELMDASLRTEVDHAEVEEVTAAVEELTRRLAKQTTPGTLGIQVDAGGAVRNQGNAVVGLRNPVAPPLHVERYPDGKALASFTLGALYEGPPGLVHGGVSALVLDQMLGEACAAGGAPGMTGTLTLRYRRPTPLGDLTAEAWIESVEGHKTVARGHLRNADGEVTVEAEGLFVLPRWAREALATQEQPPTFE